MVIHDDDVVGNGEMDDNDDDNGDYGDHNGEEQNKEF